MSSGESRISRRRLLGGILGAAAATTLAPQRAGAQERARVVRVESPKVWSGDNSRDKAVVAAMVGAGMLALTDEKIESEAWSRFFKPGMRVGLKINLLGRPLIYTAPEITDAVVAGVIAVGVKPSDVTVWDRHASHFEPTRYRPGRGSRGETIKTGGDYDTARACRASGGAAPIDRIATELTDVTVNMPLLKDHSLSGVTLALKNIAFGCYNHPGPAHGGNCDPFIAEAYSHYVTQTRVPLHILDATEACYDQGPQPGSANTIWRENAIYFATDAVALDVVCREVILAKQRAAGLNNRMSMCRHIETAARKGLGVGDLPRIDVKTVKL